MTTRFLEIFSRIWQYGLSLRLLILNSQTWKMGFEQPAACWKHYFAPFFSFLTSEKAHKPLDPLTRHCFRLSPLRWIWWQSQWWNSPIFKQWKESHISLSTDRLILVPLNRINLDPPFWSWQEILKNALTILNKKCWNSCFGKILEILIFSGNFWTYRFLYLFCSQFPQTRTACLRMV